MTPFHVAPLSRCADGRRWWIKDRDNYQHHTYNIAIEPLLREIRTPDGRVVGHVTRNRYEAEVLNTNQMLIVDIDIQDDHGRCPSARLYQAVLEHARHGERIDFVDLLRFQLEGGRQDWEESILLEGSWRLYQTRNGYRLLEASEPWGPEPWPGPVAPHKAFTFDKDREEQLSTLVARDAALIAFMNEVYADSDYIRICLDQRLFRARLTEKPWRKKKINGLTRTCSYLTTVGTGVVHPDLAPLLREHDAVTGAHALGGTLA